MFHWKKGSLARAPAEALCYTLEQAVELIKTIRLDLLNTDIKLKQIGSFSCTDCHLSSLYADLSLSKDHSLSLCSGITEIETKIYVIC